VFESKAARLSVLALAVVITIALACDYSDPTAEPSRHTETQTSGLTSTSTPVSFTYEEFCRQYQTMTELQQEQYAVSVVGTRVRWTARVEDVTQQGRIDLESVEGYYFIWVYLDGVPIDQASALNKGQLIEFEATVRETGTGRLGVGFAVYLDDPVMISPE